MNLDTPHNLSKYTKYRKTFKTEACSVFIYDNLLVLEATEGTTLCYSNGFSLLLKCLSVLGNKPWFLISHRINSYSVNPNDYKYLQKVPTLKGIAIVYINEQTRKSAELEKSFFNKPYEVFTNIEDACKWGFELLKK